LARWWARRKPRARRIEGEVAGSSPAAMRPYRRNEWGGGRKGAIERRVTDEWRDNDSAEGAERMEGGGREGGREGWNKGGKERTSMPNHVP